MQRAVGADQVEERDQEDHRREEREQRAVRDLLREAHAVVGEELLAARFEDREPVARQAPSVAVDKEKRPKRALSAPRCRPISRIVAPIPPAMTNPAASAPAVITGSFARTFAPMSVASRISSRRWSTAPASCSRSAWISCRTWSGVRWFVLVAIGLERLRRELRLDGSPAPGSAAFPSGSGSTAIRPRIAATRNRPHRDDQDREPRRHRRRQPGGDRREQEAEAVEGEDGGGDRPGRCPRRGS